MDFLRSVSFHQKNEKLKIKKLKKIENKKIRKWSEKDMACAPNAGFEIYGLCSNGVSQT